MDDQKQTPKEKLRFDVDFQLCQAEAALVLFLRMEYNTFSKTEKQNFNSKNPN